MPLPSDHYVVHVEESRRLHRAGGCAWRVFDMLKWAMLRAAQRDAARKGLAGRLPAAALPGVLAGAGAGALSGTAAGADPGAGKLRSGELSIEDMAALAGLHERSVRRALAELEALELIRIKRGRAGHGYELVHGGPPGTSDAERQALQQSLQDAAAAMAGALDETKREAG